MKKGILFLAFVGALALAQSVFAADAQVCWQPSELHSTITGEIMAIDVGGTLSYEVWGGKQGATALKVDTTEEHCVTRTGIAAVVQCYFVIARYHLPPMPEDNTATSATVCKDFSKPDVPLRTSPEAKPDIPRVTVEWAPK